MVAERKGSHTIETEVKIACLVNPLVGRSDIEVILVEPRHFEDNFLFDFDDQRLASTRRALRLRIVGQRGWLTLKQPPREHSWLKVREEIQVSLEEPHLMPTILHAIGLTRIFRYQKFRTIYQVRLPGGKSLDAMYDETPMGNFLELEGEDLVIAELVQRLNIPRENLIQGSYPALWMERQQAKGQLILDMVFRDDQLKGS